MSVPQVSKQNVLDAMKFIDQNGIPGKNESTKYVIVSDDGKKYPPKYVIAVAHHLATGADIRTDEFVSVEARALLRNFGFTIEEKQEKFELVITANDVTSTDERFTMNNLALGDEYKPLDTYFKNANGGITRRKRNKSENKISGQTMPRLACQIFESRLFDLSDADKRNFPICRYKDDGEMIRGIFPTVEDFKKSRNTIEFLTYRRENGPQFVFYCWNIFSTIIFVQECLKRFGDSGDQFVLSYREKDEKEEKEEQISANDNADKEKLVQEYNGYLNPYSSMLIKSKNIIFRGAPGTGKTYLAYEIAADIISYGYCDNYRLLTEEQKQQVEFVQFHPSYDYSDFVEGLRPCLNDDGTMGFELKDGVFKKFVEKARKNYEDSMKSLEEIEREVSAQDALIQFLNSIELGIDKFKTRTNSEFSISSFDDRRVIVSNPNNEKTEYIVIQMPELQKLVESGQRFDKVGDIKSFLGKRYNTQQHSYEHALIEAINKFKKKHKSIKVQAQELKKYIFIIDEINRGEISKILGELFFSIDPGYRGSDGVVSTQYANMHSNPEEKFYIPENVYIIGTMNDIDRSVDSFDFAMRRRFRFVEIKAEDRLEMLNSLGDVELMQEAIERMSALNKEIVKVDDLNENYQIGAAYFLKLKELSFDELWTDCLQPLLQDYVRGMYDEEGIMLKFAKAYGYSKALEDESDETAED